MAHPPPVELETPVAGPFAISYAAGFHAASAR